MRFALASLGVVALLATSGAAMAQNNGCTTVVLHATTGVNASCAVSTLDCGAVPPLVSITNPSGPYTVFMYLKNYGDLNGVQCAFDWPVTWTFGFGLWNCQTGQLTAVTPTAPGPTTGSISTAFNAISGGALAPIGLMVFNTIGTGCLSIIESSYPFGNIVNDASGGATTPLSDTNEGKVCVDSQGLDTCVCQPGAVEPASWGAIKGTYR
jgi:hypothetical protein